MKGRWLQVAVGLMAVGALVVWLRRPTVAPEQAVRQVVDDFCRHLAERHPAEALKLISQRFEGDEYTKRDVVQGVITLLRQYEQISIHIADMQVHAAPDRRSAEADIYVAINAWGDGRLTAMGEDRPLHVTARFEREGRRWRVVAAQNVPVLTWGF